MSRPLASPARRASGLDWAGAVPAHWDVAPLRTRFDVQLGKMLDEKRNDGSAPAPYLRNQDVQWGRINTDGLPQMDFGTADRAKYGLRPGDVLVCEGGEVGRAAVWAGEAECYYQKALHRLRARGDDDPRFMYYLLAAAARAGAFAAGANVSTIGHLTAEKLKATRFPFPPADEQRRIVAGLDARLRRVEAVRREQALLAALVEEARHGLTSGAVTKGVRCGASLRPSGLGWAGDVPAHWRITRLVKLARLESGHTPSRQRLAYWENCTVPWFTLGDIWQVRGGWRMHVTDTAECISELGLANSAARLLPAGTVMLSRTASVGFAAIMGRPMATTQDFANWVCGPDIRPEYLLHVFRSMRDEFRRLMAGSTHKTIYMPDVRKLEVPVPPLAEQDAIVTHLREAHARLEALSAEVRGQAALLEEYRAGLIASAVAGEITADLPPVAPAVRVPPPSPELAACR